MQWDQYIVLCSVQYRMTKELQSFLLLGGLAVSCLPWRTPLLVASIHRPELCLGENLSPPDLFHLSDSTGRTDWLNLNSWNPYIHNTARWEQGGGASRPNFPLPYCTLSVQLLREAWPAGWVTYARVQCREPKTGQKKVQLKSKTKHFAHLGNFSMMKSWEG